MSLGYEDTPLLPGGKWTVHDGRRPQPPVLDAGTASTNDQPGRPPADAFVLFDGRDLTQWISARDGSPAKWKVENGYTEVVPKSGNIKTKQAFGDCHLHIEWAAPTLLEGTGQGRGNSGVFLMTLYEVQVLDCYQNPTYPDGTTAAIYGQYPPAVNPCRPPGQWQVYDILFIAPRFDANRLIAPAYMTVLFNGVVVHYHRALQGPTQHKKLAAYAPHAGQLPLELQDHGNPVRFRNIWLRPLDYYDQL